MRWRSTAASLGAVLAAGCASPPAARQPAGTAPTASAAASHSGGAAPGPAAPIPSRPLVYVAVGASDAFGIGASSRDAAWPYVFARTALPPGSRVLDLGIPAVTTSTAERVEVPAALAAAPDVVTVWLAGNDVLRGVRPTDYEATLGRLVARLRRGGRTTVLLGTTPPLEELPAYRACRPDPPPGGPRCLYFGGAPAPAGLRAITDAYTGAARRVARREGARVVDLGKALQSGGPGAEHTLVASDGFHPNDAGHAALGRAFAAAYRAG